MKILFLLLTMPDLRKTSNMYAELVWEFFHKGHEVYPVAPIPDDEEGKTCLRNESGINVLRVKTLPLFNINVIRKGIANVLLPRQYQKAINSFYKSLQFDLIIAPMPPITLVNVVGRMKRRCNAKFYLILRDIFPQNAVDLGYIKRWMPLYWRFRRQEKKFYLTADTIGCMSRGNIDYIKIHNPGVDCRKLHVLENFQREETVSSGDADLKKRYGIDGKFVAVYGGNMGVPHRLENIVALAKMCQADYTDVLFLIVGRGTQKAKIELLAKREGIANMRFVDFIPQADYQQLVKLCDVGLISLHEKFTIPNIPSKTLSYFNLGLPVLASIDCATDYGALLDRAGAGLWSLAGDNLSFKHNFDRLYTNEALRQKMGANGRKYFQEHMTVQKAYETIIASL